MSDLLTLSDIAELAHCSVKRARTVIVKLPVFPEESPVSTPGYRSWLRCEVLAAKEKIDAYLEDKKVPKPKARNSEPASQLEWELLFRTPLMWGGLILRPNDRRYPSIRDIPNEPGIYAIFGLSNELLYIGRSVHMATRLRQHEIGRIFHEGVPTSYAYKIVPHYVLNQVEIAHIRALCPPENMFREGAGWESHDAMVAAIEAAWGVE